MLARKRRVIRARPRRRTRPLLRCPAGGEVAAGPRGEAGEDPDVAVGVTDDLQEALCRTRTGDPFLTIDDRVSLRVPLVRNLRTIWTPRGPSRA